jgi:hypothetical protein
VLDIRYEYKRTSATSERFFGHSLLPIVLYQSNFSVLQVASARVIAAGGTGCEGQFPWRTAVALAERLGTPAHLGSHRLAPL